MCGIVGIRRFDGGVVGRDALEAMSCRLEHRGPDASGVWCEGGVGFGHRRLSIIDLDNSSQPMASADDDLHITFNGEVFNYRELRAGLAYPFRTRGDTEVLLALFSERGPRGVDEVVGQFAYAIHDRRDESLWLFRDRLGVLPLYYWWDGRRFLFASEVKALLAALPCDPAVDTDSLEAYLTRRAVPCPATLFRGIRKVPPGHVLRLDASGRIVVSSYWAISGIDGASVRRVAPSRAVDLVDTALRMAVDSASVADVPVGAYLSGGVDSSLITAMAASARPESPVATFSAVFDDARVDEGPHARRVSALLGTAHHEVTVSPADFEALWAKLTWQRDAPLSEPADIAVFQLARLASHRVKVVLSGEGSDELFAGYPKYRAAAWAALAGYVPSAVRRPLCRGLDRVLPESARRARVGLGVLSAVSQEERLNAWFAPFTSDERRSLLGQVHGPGATNVAGPARAAPVRVRDLVGHMLEADCRGWLTDNLLERGDRMSMAASVELRPPFLDHRLVELAFSLPTEVKLRRNVGKWVVKEVARRYLPAEIVDRPKVGFRVPLDSWFRTGLRSMAWDLLLSPGSFVTSAFDPVAVRKILDSHDRGRRNEDMRIWTLLSLEIWHDVFFKDPAPARGDNRAVAGPRR